MVASRVPAVAMLKKVLSSIVRYLSRCIHNAISRRWGWLDLRVRAWKGCRLVLNAIRPQSLSLRHTWVRMHGRILLASKLKLLVGKCSILIQCVGHYLWLRVVSHIMTLYPLVIASPILNYICLFFSVYALPLSTKWRLEDDQMEQLLGLIPAFCIMNITEPLGQSKSNRSHQS